MWSAAVRDVMRICCLSVGKPFACVRECRVGSGHAKLRGRFLECGRLRGNSTSSVCRSILGASWWLLECGRLEKWKVHI